MMNIVGEVVISEGSFSILCVLTEVVVFKKLLAVGTIYMVFVFVE